MRVVGIIRRLRPGGGFIFPFLLHFILFHFILFYFIFLKTFSVLNFNKDKIK